MPTTPEVCPYAFCPQVNGLSETRETRATCFQSWSTYPSRTGAPFFRVIFSLLFIFFLHSSFIVVQAQSTTATLSGTVMDQAGAVVSGANIAVISMAPGFQRSTTTNAAGSFVVALLPPSNYAVKAEREGFITAELRDVILNVNDQKVIKVYLKVGNISQTVEIVDSTNLIDESAAVSTVVDRPFVSNLPLNGRSFQFLISLTTGVFLTRTSGTEQGQFSVNRQRASTNYFTVDGVSANVGAIATVLPGQSGTGSLPGMSASGETDNLVSVDALEEFKLQTSTYAPEFGRTPGAQVSIVTRSGTNAFHGSVFDYVRNNVPDATDFFAKRCGLKRTALRQNDFGAMLDGPIRLPRSSEGRPPSETSLDMEVSPINRWAIVCGTVAFVLLFALRWQYRRAGRKEIQVAWAAVGGCGAGAAVKSIYPIYRVLCYGSLAGIEDLWLYVYVGSLAVAAFAVIAIYSSWKTA